MNRGRRRNLKAGVILVSIAIGISYVAAAEHAQHGMQPGQGGVPQKVEEGTRPVEGLDMIHSTRLPATQKMLERAIQHLEAGHQQEALKELRLAQSSLDAVRQALGRHIEPPIANARCPIMGSRINAAGVPASLTRMYGGQKVAFCCAGCPEAWDQLDDAQKTAKLASAIAKPQPGTPPTSAPARPQPRTPSRSAPVRPPQHRH